MKSLRTPLLCACMIFLSICSNAQNSADRINEPDYNKPKLFADLPDNITANITGLTELLGQGVGQQVRINLGNGPSFIFEGQVVSAASKYNNTIQSVVIRSVNFNGAVLSFSRTINADKASFYTGRIVSLQHGDLFELKMNNGQFVFIKKNFYDLVNE